MRSDLMRLQTLGNLPYALHAIAAEVGDEATESFAAWSWCRPRASLAVNGQVAEPWTCAVWFCTDWEHGCTPRRSAGAWDQRRSGFPPRRWRRQAIWIC